MFWVVHCRSLFVVLSFIFKPLYCLSFCHFLSSDYLFGILKNILECILQITFKGKDRHHAYVISDICCRPHNYSHVETPYKIISSVNIICFQSDYYHVNHVLYSYEVEFNKGNLEKNLNNLSRSFNVTFPN